MNKRILAPVPLTDSHLQAIKDLHKLCESHESIAIKINWDMIKNGERDDTFNFLCYEEDRLIGYMALYVFQSTEGEISAIVHPEYRRSGTFGLLLEEARQMLQQRGIPQFLFIVDEKSGSGQRVARHLKLQLDHSEFKMEMPSQEAVLPNEQELTLLAEEARDAEAIAQLDVDCFHMTYEDALTMAKRGETSPHRIPLIYKDEGGVKGKIRVSLSQKAGGQNAHIYGFCVAPELQGQGIGSAMLAQVLRQYRPQVATFSLEVAGENRLALRLYEKCGFRLLAQDDYYAMPVGQ